METRIATICSKNFLPGLKVLLKSFKNHNPHLSSLPVVVFYDPEQDHFTSQEINECKSIYSNLIWTPIQTQRYKGINFDASREIYIAAYPGSEREFRTTYLHSYYKYEVFSLDCDRVVFLDADMLILGDISYLFEVKSDFAAVPELKQPDRFNGGLLCIGNKYLGNKIVDDLITMSRGASDYDKSILDGRILNTTNTPAWRQSWLADQPILNSYFKDVVEYLPTEYNILKSDYRHMGSWLSNTKILHYVCKKPWDGVQAIGADAESVVLDKLWWDCWND